MYRAKRLYLLLGVLVVVCAAAFLVLQMEERQEQIQTSGETVLEIDPDAVQTLSWTYEDTTLSFHRDGTWLYDDDEAFPVDDEKIQELLEQFQAFNAAFVITDVEDYGQYGLDDPQCTISLATEDADYEILLGNFSNMDEQRYVSTGDGNVYLAVSDPLEYYDAALRDLIDHDEIPSLDQVSELAFSGAENYTIFYQEDSASTYSEEDVYFTQQSGRTVPLDTSRVEDYLDAVSNLGLTNYVTYNATEEELQAYGLDDPELTVTVSYSGEDEEGETVSDTLVLHISRDPEERAAAEAAAAEEAETDEDADSEEEITAYARVGESQIVYQISGDDYNALTAAAYNDLRHREVIWADFADITQIDVSLEGADYTITAQGSGDDRTYWYQEEEVDISDLQAALEGLEAEEFTSEQPSQQEEISLTVSLNNENFPQVQIQLYRYDGSSCLAVVDGEPVSLVLRSDAVDLMEAVRAIVLN